MRNFSVRAFQEMKPQVPPALDLSVFLIEATEIKSMLEVFTKKYHAATTKLRRANDQHLSYAFGWRPLVSELKTIYEAALGLDEHLSKFLENQGKAITAHYGEKIYVPSHTQTSNLGGDIVRRTTRVPFYIKLHASMRFTYSVPDYDSQEQKLNMFLDRFGLCKGWSSLWELITLSFVADWLVGIGNWISQFHRSQTEISCEVEYYSLSKSYEYAVVSTVQADKAQPMYTDSGEVVMKTYRKSVYSRAYTAPPITEVASLEAGSGMKWFLGASLIGGLTSWGDIPKGRR